jgi:cell division inhibitor SulA
MSNSSNIKKLLLNNEIWQASHKAKMCPSISTGYPELDKKLHYSGWPQGTLSELLLTSNGIGEIRLLLPLLAKLNQSRGYICWVNPPYLPYPPALVDHNIDLDKMLIVRAQSQQETIWSAQQAMTSRSCAAVLVWLPQKALCKEIRKLNLAAKNGHCFGIIIRNYQLQQHPSAAALRIIMKIKRGQQQLSIIKQPGGWSGQEVNLDLFPERVNWNPLAVSHWPVFTPKKQSRFNDKHLALISKKEKLLQLPGKPLQSKLQSEQQTTTQPYH